jgi:hypothetical protein
LLKVLTLQRILLLLIAVSFRPPIGVRRCQAIRLAALFPDMAAGNFPLCITRNLNVVAC